MPTSLLVTEFARIASFVHDTDVDDLPAHTVDRARWLLLDLLGVAAAGARTELSRIVRDHAVAHFGAGPGAVGVPMLFDGREVSPAGAALAGGMTIDAIDAHDGHRLTKGHTGCGLLPSVLAFHAAQGIDEWDDLLTALVIGYEVGTRAGIALHATASDYHTSGAWISVGCALVGARALGLDTDRTAEAIGIAEYHGPRSPMMRVIDHPTMLKDGSGWGAMAGTSAAYLAADGFTGAPAVTVTTPEVAAIWSDLGTTWLIEDQYLKPVPVCRWAQPAVAAVQGLLVAHGVSAPDVAAVEVTTFHEAARLAVRHPATTEQAQYSLPFPVAATIVHGEVTPLTVTTGLEDPAVNRLSSLVTIVEDEAHNEAFPARRFARVTLTTHDGRRLASADTEAPGDPHTPLTEREILDKFRAYAGPAASSLEEATSVSALLACSATP